MNCLFLFPRASGFFFAFFFPSRVTLGDLPCVCVRLVAVRPLFWRVAWLALAGAWRWGWFVFFCVGPSLGEEAILDSPLCRQLSGDLPHQGHRETLADLLQGL